MLNIYNRIYILLGRHYDEQDVAPIKIKFIILVGNKYAPTHYKTSLNVESTSKAKCKMLWGVEEQKRNVSWK